VSRVREQDGQGQIGITVDEGVEALQQHGLHQRSHFRDVCHGLHQRVIHEGEGAFGYVHREIADAFQVGIDLQRGCQETKVACHRLAQGQEAGGQAVDLHFHAVDARLIANHILGKFPVLFQEGTHRAVNSRFHEAAHLEQLLVRC
jgi:hypothetical protein